jgi:nitronate monooxygenase
MATQEAPIHPKVKEWLIQASEDDTMLVMRSLRNTERVLKNGIAEKVTQMEQKGASLEKLSQLVSGKGGGKLLSTGDLECGLLACGEVVGLIRGIPTVDDLVQGIIREAEEIIKQHLDRLAVE